MVVRVKREAGGSYSRSKILPPDAINTNIDNDINNNHEIEHSDDDDDDEVSEVVLRRALRSRYLAVKNLLSGEGEDLSEADSEKFKTVIDEVETLHQKVQKPREQVADAEALLDITSSFLKSVNALNNGGVTPSDFVGCIIRDFGKQSGTSKSAHDAQNLVAWKDIGLAVSNIFKKGTGCGTMLGPMSLELKKRKQVVRGKHVKPTGVAEPEQLNSNTEEKTDTDKNMSTMFGILRKYRKVQLEHLVLNRKSFAQTVENLFALSFLVKDGRAEITANESGHFVFPRNAPAAEAVTSRKVAYCHFVFRYDFRDWQLMLDSVEDGKELMPHRMEADLHDMPEPADHSAVLEPETVPATTPIRKLSRNRGLILQEQTIIEDSPESKSSGAYMRKGKRKVM